MDRKGQGRSLTLYIERDIYQNLLAWKTGERSTLEVNGARQTGKTYIVRKFAEENFKKVIYVNLYELSGRQFLDCYHTAVFWEPSSGRERPQSPLTDALRMYDPDFTDGEETAVIIDEIQESAEIYNRIRELTRLLKCRVIVTGSYLGRVLEPEFRYSSGDVTSMTLYTLSFEEFIRAKDPALYQEYLMPGQTGKEETGSMLFSTFELYSRIGGYPAVVEKYLATGSEEKAAVELVRIIDTFINESMRYFTDILDVQVFSDILLSISRILCREKKGLESDSASEELQKLVIKLYSSKISKSVCNRALGWLCTSGIIGLCGKVTEMDILDFKPACRYYFMDLGVASYYLKRIGSRQDTMRGMLYENYVYINLKKRQDHPEEIIFETPAFATYKGGEIDFVVQGISSDELFCVEVKAGRNAGNSARKVLADHKADHLLYLKGDTKGGKEGKITTLPIYLLERYRFCKQQAE